MNLKYMYWAFKEAIPPKICDDIIKYYHLKKERQKLATVGGTANNGNNLNKQEIKKLKKTRDSNIVWTDDSWISRYVLPYIKLANEGAGWNFQLNGAENFQLTKYSPGGHYDWHCDSWESAYKEGDYAGNIRKLSMTLSLTDKTEYEGGELLFSYGNDDLKQKRKIKSCNEVFSKGSLVVFPSFIWHKVQPVMKGTRYSLVIWNLGNPFL